MKRVGAIVLGVLWVAACGCRGTAGDGGPEYEVVVYGGTSAGVMAAVAAAREGARVVLLESGPRIGGLTTGGLFKTDRGRPGTVGGLAREFYNRVHAHYRETYGADSEQAAASDEGHYFEPRVALRIMQEMLAEAGVEVRLKERLEAAEVVHGRLVRIATRHAETGEPSTIAGRLFIDGTYEGDLMARAGVLYRVGREARSEYGESLAGINNGPEMYLGKGDHRVQAYNIRGTVTNRADIRIPFPKPDQYDPTPFEELIRLVLSHRIPTFEDLFRDIVRWALINGKGDPNKANLVGGNFAYAEADYEARARILKRVQDNWLSLWWMLQHDERLPGEFRDSVAEWGLPADEFVETGHVTPQLYVRVARRMLGRHMLTEHDLRTQRHKPDTICLGSYNMDSHLVQHIQAGPGAFSLPMGQGPTNFNVKELSEAAGGRVAEGGFNESVDAYEIPYRSITPYGVDNLLVVAAISATHVAYSSLRMEPVFMMLGQAGGLAARLALREGVTVQEVPVGPLQDLLRRDGVPLEAPYRPVVGIRAVTPPPYVPGQTVTLELDELDVRYPLTSIAWNFDGSGEVQATTLRVQITVPADATLPVMLIASDRARRVTFPARHELRVGAGGKPFTEVTFIEADLSGRWIRARGSDIEYRQRIGLLDAAGGDGSNRAVFTAELPEVGRYKVALAWGFAGNRATNVQVLVDHVHGTEELTLNQRRKAGPFAFAPVGTFEFCATRPASVTITNEGADGFVMVDSVRWIRVAD